MPAVRKIVRIDEERCNGCGQCVTACAEGAIAIVEGKARLVSESYCDGLGACLGDCPQDAITVEEREAEAFDAEAVEEHLRRQREQPATLACGCPGTLAQTLHRGGDEAVEEVSPGAETPSQLGNWPVQIHLVPPKAPYLDGARLLIAADCVPFAYADFHRRLLAGRTLMVGCPKLDDAGFYQEKLTQVFRENAVESVDVVTMEVPCCSGLVRLVAQAIEDSGKTIPMTRTTIGVRGGVLETVAA